MAVRKHRTLWCDYPGCCEWTTGIQESSGDSNALLRHDARREGWRRVAGVDQLMDLCPAHPKSSEEPQT